MTALAIRPVDFRRAASALRYRLSGRIQRVGRAWRYMRGAMTENDAYQIMREGYDVIGSYPLETLDVSSLIEYATDKWEDHPALPDLCREAAERVYGKWSSDGHVTGAAEEWAMDLIPEYAAGDGITLIERVDGEDEDGGGDGDGDGDGDKGEC